MLQNISKLAIQAPGSWGPYPFSISPQRATSLDARQIFPLTEFRSVNV